ncbi:MAG: hypothetical protein V3T05_12400, partial [Myxococcota bacterium]
MTVAAWALTVALAAPGGSSAEADGELTANDGRPTTVDASRGVVFGMQWRRPLVRTGIYRSVVASFGRPGVSKAYGLVVVGSGEGEVRAYRLVDGSLVWR